MEASGLVVAIAAALIAIVGVVFAAKARGDSQRSADAAVAAEHRARRPRLRVEPEGSVAQDADSVIYRVHNLDGPDLRSVVVYRPVMGPADAQVRYHVAATDGPGAWEDEVEIGPLPLAQHVRFTFSIGSAPSLPEFHVRIVCSADDGAEPWEFDVLLETPRGPARP